MGFSPNESNKQVVKESRLFSGLANVKVVAFNPSKSELEAMGYKPQSDPSYLTREDGVKKLRLDIHLAQDENLLKTKVAFFLENKLRTNKDETKAEWINDSGRTAWGTLDDPPNFKWFDATTARRAYVGEADIHNFLINWLNISPQDEAKLESFVELFNGNYTELKNLFKSAKDNEVKVLLGVREGKYQSVYNRYFDRASNKRTNYWESHINTQTEAGYPPKEDFQNNFTFQEWVEPTMMEDNNNEEDKVEDTAF